MDRIHNRAFHPPVIPVQTKEDTGNKPDTTGVDASTAACGLADMPVEILNGILRHMTDPQDFAHCSSTDRRIHAVLEQNGHSETIEADHATRLCTGLDKTTTVEELLKWARRTADFLCRPAPAQAGLDRRVCEALLDAIHRYFPLPATSGLKFDLMAPVVRLIDLYNKHPDRDTSPSRTSLARLTALWNRTMHPVLRSGAFGLEQARSAAS